MTVTVMVSIMINSFHTDTECNSAIIPSNSTERIAIAAPSMPSSITALIVEADDKGGTRFHFYETDEAINSSVCQIASLEVYRGRKQAISINYRGFSMSDSGAIEVSHEIKWYAISEYMINNIISS